MVRSYVRPARGIRAANYVRRNWAARRVTQAVRTVGGIRRARARSAAVAQMRRNWAARRVTQAVRMVGAIRRARSRSRVRVTPGGSRWYMPTVSGYSYAPNFKALELIKKLGRALAEDKTFYVGKPDVPTMAELRESAIRDGYRT